MSNIIQAVRGMHDILPDASYIWRHVEQVLLDTFNSYGYQEIRLPILEKTDLFKRTIGTVTDIVGKEMYTFADKSEESLSLRPEGTAGCVRAAISNGHMYRSVQRLWYSGPFFRRERPQQGRCRQFHQVGAEVFALSGPDIDAELILLTSRILKNLNIAHLVHLEINSLGSIVSRQTYRQELLAYFSQYHAELDTESQQRLTLNPLRILDSKNPQMATLIAEAPKLLDYLDTAAASHWQQLLAYLDHAGLKYTINPHLVRGLDYYSNTVFEWVSPNLGAQATVCAGGRYDGLIHQLGGKSTPAIGFALGLERAILLIQQQANAYSVPLPHVYVIPENNDSIATALILSEQLRSGIPGINVVLACGHGNLSTKFKKADKSGAIWAIIIGSDERVMDVVTLKSLRVVGVQQTIKMADLVHYLRSQFLATVKHP